MNSNIEQIIPLAMGGMAGLLVGIIFILVCGLSGVSRTSDGAKIYSGSLLMEGLSGLAFNAKRIIPLFLVIAFLYILSTLASAALGIPLGFMDLLTGTGAVFLGHRFLLEKPLRETGQELGERGFLGVLVRSLLMALILVIAVIILALPYFFIMALLQNAGASTGLPDLVLGFALGLAATGLSVLMARFSFMFPAAALGRKTWLATAGRESHGIGWALAGALWSNFLIMLVFTVLIMSGLGFLHVALGLPVNESSLVLTADDPAFIWEFIFVEMPMLLILTAYSLASISIVSAAYRRVVIDPLRGSAAPVGASE